MTVDTIAIAAATHPIRAHVLDAMREPTTAATVARLIGQSRQNVAYHVNQLEKAGLLRRVGERRNGNFIEVVYERVEEMVPAWWTGPGRAAALAEQPSLADLFATGEQLQRDAAALVDHRNAVPSASVTTEIRFATDEARAAFVQEYVDALTELTRKHGARRGRAFRLLLAVYPDPGGL